MAKDPRVDLPKEAPKTVEEAGETAIAEIVESPTQFVFKSRDAEILKGNQHPPGGWLHGPAQLQLFRAGYRRLVRVGEMLGEPVRNITHVRIARLKGTKKIYIWPVEPRTPQAIPLTGSAYTSWINLISLLGNENALPTRRRERFALRYTADGPEGVALVMDLSEPLEARIVSPSKRKTKGTGPDAGSEAGAGGSTAGAGGTGTTTTETESGAE